MNARVLRLLFAVACLLARFSARADVSALPPNPRLLLNAKGVAALKQRIATTPWAGTAWSNLQARADRELNALVVLPPRGGNWSHNYVCPEHGARLQRGKQIGPWQWEHICPVGNHVLHGDPSVATLDFDGNAISEIHGDFAAQVVNHGLVYQVTGDVRHARKAREILLAYAARYSAYELHDNYGKPGRGGRVASQSLTEATWLIDIAQGADLVWSTLDAADRKTIADQLLMPPLHDVILPDNKGIHNIQCRLNSAIGLVGFLLGDQKLITRTIDGPVGCRAQLEKGVRADGMWLEGSSGYHFFTVAGLWPLTEAARNCGVDLYTPQFKRMFDGPLALAMPDFTLPDFNDSGTVPLQNQADAYELAFARFHNPLYVPILAASPRKGRLAMLFGETSLPAGGHAESGSRNSTASGYAILQEGEGRDATWLCVKYGPHGGGHGHPDKNHFILYARGQVLAPDGGVHAYGSPLHAGWDKTTFAHNTLVVDGESQSPATGQSIAFGAEHGVQYSVTDAGPIHPGVQFFRTVAMLTPELVVFVDQVQADAPHTFDLAYHQMGVWEDLPSGQPWQPPATPGYKYLTEATIRDAGVNCLALKTRANADWSPAITLAGDDATQVITGYGILKTTAEHVPLLVQRRRAKQTVYVWAVSIDGVPVNLGVDKVNDPGGKPFDEAEAALVRVRSGERKWELLVNPLGRDVAVAAGDGTASRSVAAFGVR